MLNELTLKGVDTQLLNFVASLPTGFCFRTRYRVSLLRDEISGSERSVR